MERFGGIIGASAAVRHLQNALRRQEISHAYLLVGEQGSGRMQLARTFGKTLLCAHPVEENGLLEPCGTCPACIRAAAESHPDLQTFTQDRLSAQDRGKNSIGVRLIRLLTADVQIKPYEGGRKVYIVPDAERLTTEAQNALLKTLEEPPAYATLILIADGTSNFLPTILSRCVTLRFQPLDRQELAAGLQERFAIDRETALLAAGLAHGNPGAAGRILSSSSYRELYTQTMQMIEGLERQTAYDIAELTGMAASMDPIGREKASSGGDRDLPEPFGGETMAEDPERAGDPVLNPVSVFLDLVTCVIRDLMVYKSTGDTERLILRDRIPYIRNTAQRVTYEALQQMQEDVLLAGRRRSVGGRDEQILEMMLLAMREDFRA